MIYQYTLKPKVRQPSVNDPMTHYMFDMRKSLLCKQANARLLEHGMGSFDDNCPASDQTRAENDAYAAIWLLPHEVQDYVELHLTECHDSTSASSINT